MKKSENDNLIFEIVRGNPENSFEISKIEEEYLRPPWSEKIIKDELANKNSACFVCKLKEKVIGYIFFRYLFEEGEILRICVKPEYRKMKIGSELIEAVISFGCKNNVSKIFLEVRKSNFKAIGLYEKFGFLTYAERKGYYSDNGEDALLMERKIEI